MRILGSRFARPILSILAIAMILASTFSIISPPARAYKPRDPIVINGNADFTAANGVDGGTGTSADPYVISGWDIFAHCNTTGCIAAIEVRNTTSFFTIRGVSIESEAAGVFLSRVANARIESTSMQGSYFPLWVENSVNVTLSRISAADYVDAQGTGVTLIGVANARIESSAASGGNIGLQVDNSVNVTLSGNSIRAGGDEREGFGDGTSTVLRNVSNLSIVGNDIEAFGSAFVIVGCSHLLFSRNKVLAGRAGDAAYVRGCSDATISNNTFGGWEEGTFGVSVSESADVRIVGNSVNGRNGTRVRDSTNLSILSNTVYVDTDYGISLYHASGTIISGNLVKGHLGPYSDGIVSALSNNTQIFANNVTQASRGISLLSSTGILVYHNNLVNNTVQAVDDRSSENSWDNGYPSGGNFWSDYTGGDNCSGFNQDVCTGGDGIGDTPRTIDSDSGDRYPLMRQAATPPLPLRTDFTWDPCCPTPFQSMTFTAGTSGGTGPYSYSWSFGDGSSATGNPVAHTYSTGGAFTITLTTSDSGGQTASRAKTLTILPCSGTRTFIPADATIRADTPDTNYGSSTTLVVDSSPLRNLLLKFSISGIGGCPVASAKLRLYQVDSSSTGGDFHTMANSWTESTVNWNNAPAASTTTLASIGPVSAGNWYEVDLSSVVKGDGVVSFRATSSSSDGAYYSSREGTNPPQLVVTLSSSPAPSPTTRTLTFKPTDDSYIRADMASSNFGSDTRLVADASPLRDFLLKFTTSGIGTSQILSAKLRLYQVDSSDKGGDVHTTSTSWTEAAITWNNAPAAGSTIASIGRVFANTWYEVDVIAVVKGDGTVSFRVNSPSSDGAYYSSKEGLTPPQLVITVSG